MPTDGKLPEYPFEPFRGDLPDDVLRMVHARPVSRVRLPDGRPTWLVLGYREVCTVLSDSRFTREASPRKPVSAAHTRNDPLPRELGMDGAPHSTLRRLAARAFSPRRIESYRPRVQQLTDGLLDAMVAEGAPADLVAALIAPLPALVICELLGVPAGERDCFNVWIVDIMSITAYGSPAAAKSTAELRAYLTERLSAKRAAPADDLLSAWIEAQAYGELTDEEIVGLAVGVLLGGREINSTSAGLRALFLHPNQLARLRAEPNLLPGAVDEILRYTTVSSMFLVQTATEDLILGDVSIRAGDCVMAVPWAANRHAEFFSEPEVFDVCRTNIPHLTFGYGPHFCLGAALGRMEIEVELGTLLRRFPDLAPAIPLDQLRWRDERLNCGIAEFPVTW